MQICAAVHATQAPEEDAPPTHTHTHTETHTHTRYTGLHVPFLHSPALKQTLGGTLQLGRFVAFARTVQLPLWHQYVKHGSDPTFQRFAYIYACNEGESSERLVSELCLGVGTYLHSAVSVLLRLLPNNRAQSSAGLWRCCARCNCRSGTK